MIGKFLEICKENLEEKLDLIEISYNVKTKLEFIFGLEWFVTMSTIDL